MRHSINTSYHALGQDSEIRLYSVTVINQR